ncbi:MAG: histidine phosphatase family protein [Kiritimatiellota bacterium]|nr:histidine phosphatase family protein [Kiritimatiellota bacterium]
MPTLLLIRHGENDTLVKNRIPGRIPGIHLNGRGHEQAAELARTLSRLPIKALYSSPLERAIETAEPLAQSLGLGIQLRPDLTDTDVGDWAGRSLKALGRTRLWKVIQETPSRFQFPGGETIVQAQERVARALDAIASAHADELIAVVFHADPIKLAVAHYLGLSLDKFQRLTSHTGSVTILKMDGSAVKLLALNLIPPFSFPKP